MRTAPASMWEKARKTIRTTQRIWLEPAIEVARAGKTLRTHELNKALKIIEQDFDYLLEQ